MEDNQKKKKPKNDSEILEKIKEKIKKINNKINLRKLNLSHPFKVESSNI